MVSVRPKGNEVLEEKATTATSRMTRDVVVSSLHKTLVVRCVLSKLCRAFSNCASCETSQSSRSKFKRYVSKLPAGPSFVCGRKTGHPSCGHLGTVVFLNFRALQCDIARPGIASPRFYLQFGCSGLVQPRLQLLAFVHAVLSSASLATFEISGREHLF